ncbi:AAA family ATPase [Vibrio sp. SCSIO 43136]|uniref:AAA family ATPase n=1 Tax=Vibrio sp. SCSIO 43136 TaxID=2819101 RepID=UPI0020759D7E|nr:AAA family ATPase [Vibrio sp. SCSIO 43136]USD67842.1 AAA family ATPase [Vibrio sp. SCSIO 43136]
MIEAFSVSHFRSLKDIVTPLSSLNLVTGPNGSGKSNLYRSLKLLADTANGQLISALARDGGLQSTFWAGPDEFSQDMLDGVAPVQGNHKTKPKRLDFGFVCDDFGYSVSLGLPKPDSTTLFGFDPVIRRECIWAGPFYRPASCLVERQGSVVKVRNGRKWEVYSDNVSTFDSMLTEVVDPAVVPEVFRVRETIKSWRFYDIFRTDTYSPIRQPQIGTFSPVLDHDGHNLVAALRTIYEIGNREALAYAIDDAFPGASISMAPSDDNRLSLLFHQPGLLRPMALAELSDGTLRYLLLVAALLTPRPPSLMVLNEPETSLHPDLLPALARLIVSASESTQVWVVSHAPRLVNTIEKFERCNSIHLDKKLGETFIRGQDMLDKPAWYWPS